MPMSIRKGLAELYKLSPDDITAEMLRRKGVETIKIRVCGMRRGTKIMCQCADARALQHNTSWYQMGTS